MSERSPRRRRAIAPVGLLAALALAAGGSSTPWATATPAASLPRHPAGSGEPMPVHLEHLELVALRAQAIPTDHPQPGTPASDEPAGRSD